jgi:G patch domain-containing protein 1
VTPQVIPRKLTEDNRQKDEESERRKNFLAAVEKEKHFMGVGASRAKAKDFFDKEDANKKSEAPPQVVRKEPESELEKKAIESIDKKPEEKKDLFKAIFCDSDDEENEEQPKFSASELSDQQKSKFIESFLNTKPASEINVLRNASPPRGIFKGIFDLASTSKKIEESQVSAENQDEDFYGPKLPAAPLPTITHQISSESSSSDESDLDEKLLKKLKKVKREKSSEKWVEKDKVKKSKKEKKSKKKKHKKEHKKHKSKK